jgi:methylated-DNA-[protein]-cysteine S-methyltransferase
MESVVMISTTNIYTKKDHNIFIDYFYSPIGLIECQASETGLAHVIFCGEQTTAVHANNITDLCKRQLAQYFNGDRKQFNIPLAPKGTEFQKSVWQCLSTIAYGETVSYLDIAHRVNKPKGSQAVGGANGRNPISIIVPCHRVVGKNGSLTGYAGGIERKLWLLQHEGISIKPSKEIQKLDINNVINSRQSNTEFLHS